jgi:hypothetical protein
MRTLRVLALLLCASTLALAASGCGGGGKSFSGAKPDVWAATVCGAVGTWTQGLKASSAQLSSGLSGETDLKVVKARFVSFLETAETSSEAMVTTISAAGAPAVKDGAAIQNDLVTGLEAAQASFTHAVARAKKLSTTDPQAFATGVQALGSDVQKELTDVGTRFNTLGDKYDDTSLNKATSEEPACSMING